MILFYIKYSEGGILRKFRTKQNQKNSRLDGIESLHAKKKKKKNETMQHPSRPLAAAESCFHI